MKKCLFFLGAYLALAINTSAQCTATLALVNPNYPCGDSIALIASPGVSYSWFVNGNPISGSGMQINVHPSPGTHIYTVQVTDVNSCVALSNPITLNTGNPNVNATSNGPLCPGNTLQLTGTVSIGTYYWTGPNGFSSTQLNPTITNVQAADMGTYTLHASWGNCTDEDDVVVNFVSNNPIVNVTPGGNLCTGDSIELYSGASILNAAYTWTGPNGFNVASQNHTIFPVSPVNTGVYTVTVTGNNCNGPVTLSNTINFNVDDVPVVTASNNAPICGGSTLQLSGSVSVGTYYWTGPNGFNSTLLNPSIPNAQNVNTGTYVLHAQNGNCSANEYTYANILGATTVSAQTSGHLCSTNDSVIVFATTAGMTNVSYSWTGPGGFTSTSWTNPILQGTVNDAGWYNVTVTGIGCLGPTTLTASVFLSDTACNEVWPGDANNDFSVWYNDYLKIGQAWGATGAPRIGATTNWIGQVATDWTNTFNNALNYKFADCNGDGIVNGADTAVVSLNYGDFHLKGEHIAQAKSTAFPDLYFDISGLSLTPGATITVPIKLGSSSIMMQNVYGIAAQVKISGLTLDNPMLVNTSFNWMGDNSNSMFFTRSISDSWVDWAFVRTDHANVSGEGTIGTLTFTVPVTGGNQEVLLYFDNVFIEDKDGNSIEDVNVLDAYLYPLDVNVTNTNANSIAIVPNPSDAQANLQLTLSEATSLQINITDMTGRLVWNTNYTADKGANNIALPAQLAAGIYTIQVADPQGLSMPAMKWVKK